MLEARIASVIGAVARQALADRGLRRVALLDDGGPEAALAARILSAELGPGAVVRVQVEAGEVEPVLHLLGGDADAERAADGLRGLRARMLADALPASPANRTALLLGGDLPPEPLLPLGELYAGEVAALAGGWSVPSAVRRIVEAAGGVDALDEALRRWIDRRDPHGLDALPDEARDAVRRAFAAGRAGRAWPHLVPKLGYRTLGVDLHE
ncbi:MAG: hypothetical protein JWM27_20 [Gemmatimonadetes bacterium]|nr:hypothetical protein [Gemmatimonadota bacterium]